MASLPCVACGYELLATATDGQCPECAHPVERSVRLWRDQLDPECLRRIVMTTTFMLAAPVVFVVGLMLAAFTGFSSGLLILFALLLTVSTLLLGLAGLTSAVATMPVKPVSSAARVAALAPMLALSLGCFAGARVLVAVALFGAMAVVAEWAASTAARALTVCPAVPSARAGRIGAILARISVASLALVPPLLVIGSTLANQRGNVLLAISVWLCMLAALCGGASAVIPVTILRRWARRARPIVLGQREAALRAESGADAPSSSQPWRCRSVAC